MLVLLQRVTRARVLVDDVEIAVIGGGLCVFVGFERGDDDRRLERMCERILGYRIFSDPRGRMNRSITDTGGELLLVPNFTLAADTRKGTRPSFSTAAAPEAAEALFESMAAILRRRHATIRRGRFGAHMRVESVNDGPVAFILESRPARNPISPGSPRNT